MLHLLRIPVVTRRLTEMRSESSRQVVLVGEGERLRDLSQGHICEAQKGCRALEPPRVAVCERGLFDLGGETTSKCVVGESDVGGHCMQVCLGSEVGRQPLSRGCNRRAQTSLAPRCPYQPVRDREQLVLGVRLRLVRSLKDGPKNGCGGKDRSLRGPTFGSRPTSARVSNSGPVNTANSSVQRAPPRVPYQCGWLG
jgi:hypothetical protein